MDANVIAAAAVPAPGFGHFIAQSDAVGKFLLGVLIVMSIASWGLIAAKGISQFLRNKRAASFLDFFWNARSLDTVQAELATHGAHDPFSHLSAHAPVSYTHLDVYKRQTMAMCVRLNAASIAVPSGERPR